MILPFFCYCFVFVLSLFFCVFVCFFISNIPVRGQWGFAVQQEALAARIWSKSSSRFHGRKEGALENKEWLAEIH